MCNYREKRVWLASLSTKQVAFLVKYLQLVINSIQQILRRVVLSETANSVLPSCLQGMRLQSLQDGIQAESPVQFQRWGKRVQTSPRRGREQQLKLHIETRHQPGVLHREENLWHYFSFCLCSFPCLSKGNPRQTAETESCKQHKQMAHQGSAGPAAVAQNKINAAHPGQTPSVALYYQQIWTLTQSEQNFIIILSPKYLKNSFWGLRGVRESVSRNLTSELFWG